MNRCCDYGCDQSPDCPARIEPVMECHVACTPAPRRPQPFAPGVIDGPYPNDRQTRVLQRWALLTAILALLGFVAGYLS